MRRLRLFVELIRVALVRVALVRVALLSHQPADAVMSNFRYAEVTPSFPSDLQRCLLMTKKVEAGSVTSCAAVCHSLQSCSLFCIQGTTCHLFRAKVTSGWAGAGTGAPNQFTRCWSLYIYSNDIGRGVSTAAESVYLSFVPSNPVGLPYSCDNVNSCYESLIDINPYWMADLGSPKSVSEVRIHRYALLDPVVEFRLGNDTTAANNPHFVTSFTTTIFGELFLKPPTPAIGRYFFVTENLLSDIRVCDVWILGVQDSDTWKPNWMN
ncbi:hypothetical protein Pmani_016981 [Petrolisthes manimaculis]|uniref:F5/8 type C domain-containing protein n=1 Tax=Petrolisthes manimaculis TaxID=1843537 RepID=A0AAE1PNY7_9EUCA|nr:hypothetical protein Pmani_016981 [Petrolisthes manimaculis]